MLTEDDARARVVEASLAAMRATDPRAVAAATRELNDRRHALAAARQRRRDTDPRPRPDRTDVYRPTVIAKLGELDDALSVVERLNLELDALLDQAASDGAAAATTSGLTWLDEFGSVDRPETDTRLKAWRRFVAANGWTPPSARAASELTLRVRADTSE